MICIITTNNHEGKILEFNRSAETTFGYRREEVMGKELVELIMPPHGTQNPGVARYAQWGGQECFMDKRIETMAIHANGSEFPIRFAMSAIGSPSQAILQQQASSTDMTDRKRNEEALHARVKEMQTVQEASHAILAAENPQKLRPRYSPELCYVRGV